MNDEKTYHFSGIATVTVSCSVEATSTKEAWEKIYGGDCEWQCDEVDGEVSERELTSEDD